MLPTLIIGNKNYSSWSLRPWLALRWGGIPFEERVVPLGGPGYGTASNPAVREVSPSGRVPVMQLGDVRVHESLAICEWAAEQAPSLWPADPGERAEARALASEMHAGFGSLRRDFSMNVRRRLERMPIVPPDTRRDIARVLELWGALRARFAARGPWLFGTRSIADAMYAPVVTRLRTYAVPVPAPLDAYCATVLADDDMRRWEADAVAEPWTIDVTDAVYREDAPARADDAVHNGSCLCGAVRFEVTGPLPPPDACHCSRCRKQSGHYWASTDVPRSALEVSGADRVTWYRSSEKVQRGFCSTCGSFLFWDVIGHSHTAVAMGAFDGPTDTRLRIHIFTASKGDYYDIADGLPQNAL